ncbi:MAG TPA: protein kinase [Polyangiaceae bacterium]|nr:protein kinase [Polyangiaceae bacterium]
MSTLRVQARTAVLTLPSEGTPTRRFQRVAVRLASPWTVLIGFPLVTGLVSLLLNLQSQQRLSDLGRRAALERFAQRARFAERHLGQALSQADQLLDRTRELALEHASQAPYQSFAFALRDLALSRAGLKWLSVSFPDGTFEGVFLDEADRLCFQISRVEGGRTSMQQFNFGPGSLVERARDEKFYDPRERTFYRNAVQAGHRIWTEPYPFLPDYRSGITRAEAVLAANSKLHAVITADYDITELSGLLESGVRLHTPTVVFTPSGSLLAVSGIHDPGLTRAPSSTRPLQFRDLKSPLLRTFFETRAGQAPAVGARSFRVGDRNHVALEHRLSLGPELDFRLAALLDEASLLDSAHRQAREGLFTSLAISLLGVLLSIGVAMGIQRLRLQRANADQRATLAIQQARELGSYRLIEPLGSGGMGEVWRAEHRMLARPAAIKLMRTDLPGVDPSVLEARFELEARTLSQLRSPNTVSVFDYGRTTDGRLFLVMELLEGLPLDKLVEKFGPQPVGRIIPMLIGVCRCLSEAHSAGLVHRDIKPANIFLCYDGEGVERVKVLDFGLAKVARGAGLTAEGSVAGTPDYMAPEQARGTAIDGRADLYALGCTAFFLLTGRPVFLEATALGTVLAHQMTAPPALTQCTSQWIPSELELLILRCLSKDPEYRPRSAASLLRALQDIRIPDAQRASAEFLREWWEAWAAQAQREPVAPRAAGPNGTLGGAADAAASAKRVVVDGAGAEDQPAPSPGPAGTRFGGRAA